MVAIPFTWKCLQQCSAFSSRNITILTPLSLIPNIYQTMPPKMFIKKHSVWQWWHPIYNIGRKERWRISNMINMNSDLFSGGTSTGATATVWEEVSEEIYEGPPDFSAVILKQYQILLHGNVLEQKTEKCYSIVPLQTGRNDIVTLHT